ncbi:MAG: hypothetical protein JWO82_1298 [Akkermansiaceae bacterium]|nr:hypothetical protein [Akkermansiaceae bacterium]
MTPYMKAVLVFALILLAPAIAVADGETLYLHCFRITWGRQPVRDPDGTQYFTAGTPPAALLTLKVTAGQPFEAIVGGSDNVSGEVTRDHDSFTLDFKGRFGNSQHRLSGPVELEKPFDPEWFSLVSMLTPFRCVLSTSKDIKPFLSAQKIIDAKEFAETQERSKKNADAHREKEKAALPAK